MQRLSETEISALYLCILYHEYKIDYIEACTGIAIKSLKINTMQKTPQAYDVPTTAPDPALNNEKYVAVHFLVGSHVTVKRHKEAQETPYHGLFPYMYIPRLYVVDAIHINTGGIQYLISPINEPEKTRYVYPDDIERVKR